jgi:hypothetical protein
MEPGKIDGRGEFGATPSLRWPMHNRRDRPEIAGSAPSPHRQSRDAKTLRALIGGCTAS